MFFKDRQDAGKKLSLSLLQHKNQPHTIVLGIPRGGVIVAAEVSKKLNQPLDIIIPRKLRAPNNEELAIGAIAETGQGILNQSVIQAYRINDEYVSQEIKIQQDEAKRRRAVYRGKKPLPKLQNQTVILIDDGVATGSTMLAAITSVRHQNPKKLIVAIPVISFTTKHEIAPEADEVVALEEPQIFMAVGQFYEQFDQTTDEEVVEALSGNS